MCSPPTSLLHAALGAFSPEPPRRGSCMWRLQRPHGRVGVTLGLPPPSRPTELPLPQPFPGPPAASPLLQPRLKTRAGSPVPLGFTPQGGDLPSLLLSQSPEAPGRSSRRDQGALQVSPRWESDQRCCGDGAGSAGHGTDKNERPVETRDRVSVRAPPPHPTDIFSEETSEEEALVSR